MQPCQYTSRWAHAALRWRVRINLEVLSSTQQRITSDNAYINPGGNICRGYTTTKPRRQHSLANDAIQHNDTSTEKERVGWKGDIAQFKGGSWHDTREKLSGVLCRRPQHKRRTIRPRKSTQGQGQTLKRRHREMTAEKRGMEETAKHINDIFHPPFSVLSYLRLARTTSVS